MSEAFINTFKNKERRQIADDDWVLNSYFDAFARIYYSSDAFDLGRAPTFSNGGEPSYIKDAIRQMFVAVKDDRRGRDDKVIAVHDAWVQNYLYWSEQPDYLPAYDTQLVPFHNLPPFEKKKRYFVVDLVAHIMNNMPTCREDDQFYATQCIDMATYAVAYDLVGNVPDPNQLIEMRDADYLSSNLL